MADKVVITRSMLDADLENGLKRKEIAEKYDLSMNQVKKLMQTAGYGKRRAIFKNFQFVDDAVEEEAPVQEATPEVEADAGNVTY